MLAWIEGPPFLFKFIETGRYTPLKLRPEKYIHSEDEGRYPTSTPASPQVRARRDMKLKPTVRKRSEGSNTPLEIMAIDQQGQGQTLAFYGLSGVPLADLGLSRAPRGKSAMQASGVGASPVHGDRCRLQAADGCTRTHHHEFE
jgi:hypothetical protein